MKTIKQILLTILFSALNATTAAMALKADIGQGAFDAFCNTLSQMTNIKVGDWLIIVCAAVMVVQIIIEIKHKSFKPTMLLTIFIPLITGEIVNFIYYNVFSNFEITSYIFRLLFFLVSNIASAACVAGLMVTDFSTYPLEALCSTLEKYTKHDFKFYRQIADVILIVVSLALCFIFSINFTIREGTVISMLIYAPMTAIFMKLVSKIIKL